MSRPTLEVADIVRAAGDSFWDKHKSHFAWVHRKVLDALVRCRTPSTGANRVLEFVPSSAKWTRVATVDAIGTVPNSPGNGRAELARRAFGSSCGPLPSFPPIHSSFHTELCSLILQNKRLLYDLLFRTSAASLLELARDPKHLGADIGFLGVLHTWGQNLQIHPHVHYIVPAGGLALDGSRWIASSHRFFLPVKALSHRVPQKVLSATL